MRKALLALALLSAACSDNGDVCDDGTSDLGAVCLPNPAAPGITANIEVQELCGRGCSDTPSCTAVFRNSQIVLDISQTNCLSQLSNNCVLQGCQTRVFPCTLPELTEGDYTVVVPGGANQLLHVVAGGQASCRILDTGAGTK